MEQIPAAQSLFEVDDLIAEIFSWLPVKSLIRFRCVCKSLNSLISDSNFVKLHLHRSVARNADFTHLNLLYRSQNASDEGYALCSRVSSLLQHNRSSIITERHRLKDKYQVVGSCNGLICLSYRLESEPYYCLVRFWNPATRLRSRKSPPLNLNNYRTRFGFGYYHLSDTYKAVAISEGNMSVYSSGANCWRSIEYFPAHLCLVARDGVYVSGTLNWLAFCKTKPSASSSQVVVVMVIVSLDLGTEMNLQLLLPCGIYENIPLETDQGLWVLKDSLCFYHDHERTHFVLWQMKDFGVEESWTCLVKVRYEYLLPTFPRIHSVQFPMCMSENDDVVIVLLHFSEKYHTINLYNQRDGRRVEQFVTLDHIRWYYAKYYVESLVSPF